MTGLLFLICHTESSYISLFKRTVILFRIDPSNETFDYPRENFLISFPLNRETVCMREEVQQRELNSSSRLRMGGSTQLNRFIMWGQQLYQNWQQKMSTLEFILHKKYIKIFWTADYYLCYYCFHPNKFWHSEYSNSVIRVHLKLPKCDSEYTKCSKIHYFWHFFFQRFQHQTDLSLMCLDCLLT